MKDTDWTDCHLTPRGWWYGTEVHDSGFKREAVPPRDCLMTVRTYSYIPANPGKAMEDWSEIVWRTDDFDALESAQERRGVMPWRAPPLSAASALEHAGLKYIRLMKLPEHRRRREKSAVC
jgi:hypothetical protein